MAAGVKENKLRSVWIWNGQKCHRKWISDIQYDRSIRNGQKFNQKWFSDIQNGRPKNNKNLYQSEIARIAIESEFQTSKNGRSIWNGQKCNQKWFSNIQNVRRRPFCKKFQKINKFHIDLKWPEMRLKGNFGHPKWPTAAISSKISKKIKLRIDLKWQEMRSKVNFGHPKWVPAAIL